MKTIYSIVILVLAISNVAMVAYINQRFGQNQEDYLGYVVGNKITIGKTISIACLKSELADEMCNLSIPKNESIDIIYDGRNGWYYGNWKYGKVSAWGWIESKSIIVKK